MVSPDAEIGIRIAYITDFWYIVWHGGKCCNV